MDNQFSHPRAYRWIEKIKGKVLIVREIATEERAIGSARSLNRRSGDRRCPI
ncbi:hypothetical protein [Oxynema aestuarii]|uniref:Uncharacterized protein n=1 Tax=Oxynema aestuarii AP17 TaxID=2064643 RepID=A0A6H1TV84_9CYAN|nr:hypothetical protein [Oxynema aestuarii]QIZ69239.1 hypothetical protein HCG48_00410 [Oxynema aestuarii AP17]